MNTSVLTKPVDEVVIRICKNATILVEEIADGIINSKFIHPDDLFNCIKASTSHVGIESGILPENTVFYREEQDGTRRLILKLPAGYHDITYYETQYPSFPLPAMVFGFVIRADGHISSKKLAIVEDGHLRNETRIYSYPFSNVNQYDFEICVGRNRLPEIQELRQLSSLPHLILSMPNNDDYFSSKYNRKGMDYREFLEYLKYREPRSYYEDVLVQSSINFNGFLQILKH